MGLIRIPEFDDDIETLTIKLEQLAEKRVEFQKQMLQLDADINMITAIVTIKAMKHFEVI